jgi:long-chain acyl-CoA synthetase
MFCVERRLRIKDSFPQGVPIQIKYPEIPVYSFMENSARKFPNRTALIFYGKKINYSNLWELSQRFSKGLIELGIRKGDRIAVLLPNTPQFIIANSAIHYIGSVVVALNPLMPNSEISRELENTECKALIILDRLLEKIPNERPETVIVAEASFYTPIHVRTISKLKNRDIKLPSDAIKFEHLLHNPPLQEKVKINVKEDLSTIMFTSGTTGEPKGVMLSHYSQVSNALQSYHWLRGWGFSAKSQPRGWPVVICAIPFFHSYGLLVLNEAISFGCTLVLIPDPTAESLMRAITKYKVTHFPLIPRIVREILDHPTLLDYDLTSLTTCASGGAHIPSHTMKAFEDLTKARMYQGYGLTEAGPSICATPIEGNPNYESSGLCYPDTEVKIVDLQLGEIELPHNKEGEIIVKGPQLMKGYWKNAESTSKTLRNGWLHTGDIGWIDEQGYLYIVGRRTERIVTAGHSIWPMKVEEALESHPGVYSAIAIGVPDPLRCSTDICAIVVKDNGFDKKLDEKDLLNYCKQMLNVYEMPNRILFRDHLPMTVMGKVDRKKVLDLMNNRILKM